MMLTDDFKVMISKMFVAVQDKNINKLNYAIKYVIENLKESEINDFSEYLMRRIEVMTNKKECE